MKRLIASVVFIFAVSVCYTQSVYVRGYVVDSSNNSLDAINVVQKGTSHGTVTNEKGYFELPILLTGADTLVFFGVGYKDRFKILPKHIDKSLTINVVLQRDTTLLRIVDISAIQKTKGSTVGIDTKVLRLTPDAVGGIESLVKMQLGVSSTNEMSSQYSVRGGSFDENSVYVNSIEVYRPLLIRSSQQEGLSIINPDLVGKVNFSAGGFPAKYGDKMSSVLDIEYKKPEKFEGNFTAGFIGVSAYVGNNSGKLSMTHGIRYKSNQYLLSDKLKLKNGKAIFKGLDTKGDFNNSFVDYQTFINYNFTKKWTASFLGNVSQNLYNFVPKSRKVQFGTATMQREFNVNFMGSEKDKFTTFFGAISLDYKPLNHTELKLTVSAFNTSESERYDLIGAYSLSDVRVEGSGERKTELLGSGVFHEHARNSLMATVFNVAHSGRTPLWKSTLEWGVSAGREIVADKIREYERRDSSQYSLPHDGQEIRMIYNLTSNNSINSLRLQAYLQQVYRLTMLKADWTFNIGIRANYWDFNDEWLISPRLNITIDPKESKANNRDLIFRLAAGIYYQSLFYKEIRQTFNDDLGNTHIAINRDIKAQRSGHLMAGMDYYFRLWHRPFKFTTELYYKPADRIIPYSVDNVRVRYAGENQAVAYTAGIDLKLFGEFVPGVDSWVSFSYMSSKEDIVRIGNDMSGDHYSVFTNKGTYLGEVYPSYIPRSNEQRYSVSLFFQDYMPNYPQYKLNLKLVWADGLPFGPPRTERYKAVYRAKPYRRVDIGVSREFIAGRDKLLNKQRYVKNLSLHLDLLNLFDIKNESSHYWVSDVSGIQWAVPNYLTNFMVNFRVSVGF
ncbi:MAG: carboxypeptidase-like regulatory domain-containing protein [Porphyromonadaceae bacterium]|nr:carboxypeptidase-like regulatory domain-containing protein [Porphyromonadaceae bacterium]